MQNLAHLPLSEIAARCYEESERYRQRQPSDARFCYELFRRALAEQQEIAWQLLVDQYQRLVWTWIHGMLNRIGAEADEASLEEIAQDAWLRLYRYIPPDRFQRFHDLRPLLKYLHTAVNSACLDWWDGQRRMKPLEVDPTILPCDPDRELEAEELRTYVLSCLQDECERAVLQLYFGDDLPPRVVASERPDLFRDATHVSRVADRMRRRLGRNPRLRAEYERRYARRSTA